MTSTKFGLVLLISAIILIGCGGSGKKNASSDNAGISADATGQSGKAEKNTPKFMADDPAATSEQISVVLPEGKDRITLQMVPETKVIHTYNVQDIELTNFSDGVCFVSQTYKNRRASSMDRMWAIMDTEGNLLTDYVISFSAYVGETLPSFYNGVCLLKQGNTALDAQYFLINKKGQVLRKFEGLYKASNFVNGVATGFVSIPDTYVAEDGLTKRNSTTNVYINTNGDYVFQNLQSERVPLYRDFQPAQPYCDGLAKYYDYHAKAWGYIDRAGKIVIPATYKNAGDFSEGLAAVMNAEELWGFIDKTGEVKIDLIYSREPSEFSGGFANIAKRGGDMGSYCLIDKTGTIRMDSLMKRSTFYNGRAYIQKLNPREAAGVSKIILVDTQLDALNEWLDFKFDAYIPNYALNGVLYDRTGEQTFYVVADGKRIFGALSGPFCSGLARYSIGQRGSKDYSCGFVNSKGEAVIVFKESEF